METLTCIITSNLTKNVTHHHLYWLCIDTDTDTVEPRPHGKNVRAETERQIETVLISSDDRNQKNLTLAKNGSFLYNVFY